MKQSYSFYEKALEAGICREQARILLPQSIYTEAYWTVSLQAVLHFLEQRLHKDSQWEIRQYAKALKFLIEDDLTKLGVSL